MTVKTYNRAGNIHNGTEAAWQPQNKKPANQEAVNDLRRTYGGVPSFSQPGLDKILKRKRKSTAHPLRYLRIQKGFTLQELANVTGFSASYLSRLESGTRRLNADILHRLAQVLSCHPGALLTTEPNPAPNKFNPSFASGASLEVREHAAPFVQVASRFQAPDLPLYHLKSLSDKGYYMDIETPAEWVNRPPELTGISGAICFQLGPDYKGVRYRPGDQLFGHPTRPLSQNCSILAVMQDNRAYLGEFMGWSSQPEKSNCLILRLVTLSRGQGFPEEELLTLENASLKNVYRIIGCIESC